MEEKQCDEFTGITLLLFYTAHSFMHRLLLASKSWEFGVVMHAFAPSCQLSALHLYWTRQPCEGEMSSCCLQWQLFMGCCRCEPFSSGHYTAGLQKQRHECVQDASPDTVLTRHTEVVGAYILLFLGCITEPGMLLWQCLKQNRQCIAAIISGALLLYKFSKAAFCTAMVQTCHHVNMHILGHSCNGIQLWLNASAWSAFSVDHMSYAFTAYIVPASQALYWQIQRCIGRLSLAAVNASSIAITWYYMCNIVMTSFKETSGYNICWQEFVHLFAKAVYS